MQERKKIYYIAELNLPSKSAYSIHVMKMCEAFSKLKYDVNLFVINNKNINQVNKKYNINYKFKIFSIFDSFVLLNFILRIKFSLKILSKKFDKECIFLSRSIIFSLLACLFRKKVILELHHEITGFSKIMYFFLKNLNLINDLKFIFLNKNLNHIYKIEKEKYLVLDDAVNLEDFKVKQGLKYKKTCVYIGSFFEGKGIEQIFRLAKLNKNINFHLYGDKKFLNTHQILKNLKVFDFISYNKIPGILSKYEIALMPYQNKVKGRSSMWLEKYMSPLKMFDYLASKMIIVASDLKVYKHILKNNYNCVLIKVNNDALWSQNIQKLFKNYRKKYKLKRNALATAKKFSWENRCKKIIFFSKKF